MMATHRLSLDEVVMRSERILFGVMVVVSVFVYVLLGWLVFSSGEAATLILFYGPLIALIAFLTHGLAVGRVRGNGVLVSERQFPVLHRLVAQHARSLGLDGPPATYVLESGGLLNAFAMRFLGRDFVIVNSDMLALAQRRGEAAVSFVVGHELGHHWRGHLRWRWLLTPARFIPYLGSAYSRACEYSCDRVGAYCEPDGAVDGLMVLAAGGWLHDQVDVQEFARQAESDGGFWIRRAELVSSHPRLPKRVAALVALGFAASGTRGLDMSTAAA